MASHVDLEIVAEHVKKLDDVGGDKDPLSVNRGKLHECLGMKVGFGLKWGVAIG